MELPDDQSSAWRPPRKSGLQGPKPTPLKLKKDSHKIKKPPRAPPAPPPVIIYTVSPKVIHANPSDFMTLVQRLTGPDSGPTTTSTSTPPAASIATATTAFCNEGEKTKVPLGEVDTTGYRLVGGGGFGPSILSSGTGGLIQPIPQTLYSPALDSSPFVNSYHQHNQDYFSGIINYDQQFQHHDDFDGGFGGAFFSPNFPMISPTSMEFLSRLLDQ